MMSEGKKFDSEKLRMDLIPTSTIVGLAEVLTHGAKKYGENTWQNLSNFNDRYYAALMRHLIAWRSGEEIDTESGLHHLKHALANICFLLEKSRLDNLENVIDQINTMPIIKSLIGSIKPAETSFLDSLGKKKRRKKK